MEAAARPLPSEDTTPPVTKMYFADIVPRSKLYWKIVQAGVHEQLWQKRARRKTRIFRTGGPLKPGFWLEWGSSIGIRPSYPEIFYFQ